MCVCVCVQIMYLYMYICFNCLFHLLSHGAFVIICIVLILPLNTGLTLEHIRCSYVHTLYPLYTQELAAVMSGIV